jgi:hypothetical protein
MLLFVGLRLQLEEKRVREGGETRLLVWLQRALLRNDSLAVSSPRRSPEKS